MDRSPTRLGSVPVGVSAIVALAVVFGAACSDPAPEVTLDDRVEELQADLIGDGATADVAECVTRLAEHDLRVGDLDPVTLDELVLNCERADTVLNGTDSGESVGPLASVDGPSTLGDDPELDALWRACADGSGQACDELFEQSPVGSEYEQFGVSCGRRDDMLNCRELDETDSESAG